MEKAELKKIKDTTLVSLRNSLKKCEKDIQRFDKKKFENKRISELYIYSINRYEDLEEAYSHVLKQKETNSKFKPWYFVWCMKCSHEVKTRIRLRNCPECGVDLHEKRYLF